MILIKEAPIDIDVSANVAIKLLIHPVVFQKLQCLAVYRIQISSISLQGLHWNHVESVKHDEHVAKREWLNDLSILGYKFDVEVISLWIGKINDSLICAI